VTEGPSKTLETRTGLPDALRVLLEDYPRESWESHPNFDGLTRFWLERHLMFREILARLQTDAEAMLDRRIAPRAYGQRLSRLGGMFLNELHGHHMIEDHQYFPMLSGRETRLAAGFELLDADHHALDGHLNALADAANAVLRGLGAGDATDDTGRLHAALGGFAPFLDRHLVDEEDLVVPVILKHGPDLHG